MNYYERYCGDYGRDTKHLSLTEHGAYTLMLDTYYSTEKPLPAAFDRLYQICGARTKADEAAIRHVAEEFFPIGPDGVRRNPRAERDIIKAAARIKAARENGMKRSGDRIEAATLSVGKPSQQEPSGIPSGLPSGLPSGSANANPPDLPPGTYGESAIPQTPIEPKAKPKTKRSRQPAEPVALPDWMPQREWDVYDDMRRAKSGRGWTLLARQMAIEELGKLRDAGHDPAAVLKQSIIASYPGLYPPRVAAINGRQVSLSERKTNTIDKVVAQGAPNGRVIDIAAERVDRPVIPALAVDLREQGTDDVRGSGRG